MSVHTDGRGLALTWNCVIDAQGRPQLQASWTSDEVQLHHSTPHAA